MRKLLATATVACCLAGGAFASLTPFTFYAGYFHSSSFQDRAGNSISLQGLELGGMQSLVSLPLLGRVDLGGTVLVGPLFRSGGNPSGNLYRIFAQYRTPSIGASPYGIGAIGYYFATGSTFDSQSGPGLEFGIGFPLKTPIPGAPGFSIEARYRATSRPANRGISVGLSLSF